MKNIKWILLGVLGAVLAIIIFQNLEATQVELFTITLTLPLALLLTLTWMLGFAFGLAFHTLWHLWRRKGKTSAQ
ncbi:MAG: hypothetical protein D6753_13735 [Planctomycetota bacterium]|nr:MAG: hypothetical protein D6753_13735 [Planctomycetota bacterium]